MPDTFLEVRTVSSVIGMDNHTKLIRVISGAILVTLSIYLRRTSYTMCVRSGRPRMVCTDN